MAQSCCQFVITPSDVNRSYQDKSFEDKAPHYATQNLYVASLTANTYLHKPKFLAFKDKYQLPFKAYEHYGKADQEERCELVRTLAMQIWSPNRLKEVLIKT